MADCVMVVGGKRQSLVLRYKAPRKAVVRRSSIPEVKRDVIKVETPQFLAKASEYENKTLLQSIVYATSKVSGVSVTDLRSPRRSKHIAQVRHVVAYLAREMTELSLPTIGRMLGGRDHSTITNSIKQVSKNYPQYAELIDGIKAELAPVDYACNKKKIPQPTDDGGKLAA